MEKPSSDVARQKLLELIAKSQAVIECRQRFRAHNRVLCVRAIDLDNDGDIETIVGAADGRLTVLSEEYEVRWSCVVGDKSPVTSITVLPHRESSDCLRTHLLILVGTESGYLYAFNKHGETVNRDSTTNHFSADGDEVSKSSYWFNCGGAINQISVLPQKPFGIIMVSEDRHVYSLQMGTDEVCWPSFQTKGWARRVFICDLNNDGNSEILVSTANRYLSVLAHDGQLMIEHRMEHTALALFAEDINNDGIVEVLIATDKKNLIALTPDFQPLWTNNEVGTRLRSIAVVDIDGDGTKEIITGGDDKYLYILDDQGEILWRHFLGARIASICTCDVDGDGIQEVIVGADDERVHLLYVNLLWVREGLYQQIREAVLSGYPADLPIWLNPSARELLRDITSTRHDEPICLEHAEEILYRGQFEQALIAFLQLVQQKVQVLWQNETEYEAKILSFGNRLGNLVIGTTDGMLRAYEPDGQELWRYCLPDQDQILSAQIGRIQGSGMEDILICSTDRQIYLIGYDTTSTTSKKNTPPGILKNYMRDPLISSVALKPEFKHTEIVFGSESQNIYVYHNGLEQQAECISTQQGVLLVQLNRAKYRSSDTPDIIAAKTDHHVSAYKYSQANALWNFKAWNRIRALEVKDIDGDNHGEIIIGSEDRNVHVVNDKGRLKWRYYLPYSVLSIHVVDIDQDGRLEVLVGCADGYLYVFDKDGNLLWKYQVDERVTAIASKENEGAVELALGTESRVMLLQVIDQYYLQDAIERCWQALIQGHTQEHVIKNLVNTTEEPLLRAFALQKAASLLVRMDNRIDFFKRFVKDTSVEVRKAIVYALLDCYISYPEIRQLLEDLSKDQDREVRLTLVAHIDQLMRYDWAVGFDYLVRFSENSDRFVRRAVMRKLYVLIDDCGEGHWQDIFHLLLKGAGDKQSTWVRQEAARSIGHFLDNQHWEILRNIYYFVSKDIDQQILLHIANHVTVPPVRATVEALALLLQDNLNTENAIDRLASVVQALQRIRDSRFGEDTWLIYKSLFDLFNLHTIQDIAQYQCDLKTHQPDLENHHFIVVRQVLESIPGVTRMLKIYLQRQHVNDRISSLQDAYRAIERLQQFMDNEYHTLLQYEYRELAQETLLQYEYRELAQDESAKKMPDKSFLELLFMYWQELLQTTLNDLRGKPEITAELLTSQTYYEKSVSVLLNIQNVGRSPAYNVRVALLHNEAFRVTPPAVTQTDILFWKGSLRAEFTVNFNTFQEHVNLHFEITYDDGEKGLCKQIIIKSLILQPMQTNEYEFVPNPYSTGTPVNDNAMFFGRSRDIEQLKRELISNSAQRIIVLHGLRRSGKTSLLRYLVKNDLLDNCIPIYIDMQNIVHEITTSRFFFRMAYHIQRTISKKKQIQIPLPLQSAFKDDPTFVFDCFLDEVEAYLQREKIVLLIDEFEILQEQAEQGLLNPTLFSYLRSMMQHRNMNFLLAGTHKLEQLTKEYWAIFYNLALPYRLSKISDQGARSLITRPVSQHITYDPFAIDKIRQLAGDQPFLLHSLCRILVDQCNDLRKTYITLHDVNALLPHALMINSIQFSSLWQLIVPEEQIALAAIAHSGRERPLSFIEIEDVYHTERIPYEPQQLRDALGSLTQQDLLESVIEEEQEDLRYRIPIGLLRIWLAQEQPIATLKQHLRNLRW